MTLLIVCRQIRRDGFESGLRKLIPGLDIRMWPDVGDVKDIKYVLVWKPPEGILSSLPNLEVIFSIGAGVDHVLGQSDLPDVPLIRFVDPNLTMRMSEYVCLQALMHHRRVREYGELQKQSTWKELRPQPGANEIRIGVMGLGVLGLDAVKKLHMIGYQVAGWSRSQKQIDGIEVFAGDAGLKPFLTRTDILVCLLPHTPETEGMLNAELISQLSHDGPLPGPVLINAGRGKIQREADILSALETNKLWAASLDVFEEEPLPETSPLWTHPHVIITPHNASISDDMAVCRYVSNQIAKYEKDEPLENIVDLKQGY
jgi:glyoxylate/hydroxypyruvate reductase A